MQELELPQKIDVIYMNKGADYQQGNQHSQRLITDSIGVETINLPIVMNDQLAKNIADITLYNMWLGRTSYSFTLPIKYAKLEPTDIVNITAGDATHKLRITSSSVGSPGVMKITGVAEDITTYDFYSEQGTGGGTDTISEPGLTNLAILDLPPMPSDTEAQGYLRYAATGTEDGWYGSVIFRSDDGGANYAQVASVSGAAAIGVVANALADGTTDYFDEANSVTVIISGSAELEGVSELAVLNGANVAKLGDEIIQFKTATLIDEGKYELSGLLRGRQGTEWATSTHIVGEEFVLLDNSLAKELMPNNVIGLERLYKGVSVGATISGTDSESFTYRAVALKPFSPVHITGTRDGGGNLTIEWVRRTRINGGWQDNVDVPLGEAAEAYEVDIMDGADVARTITVSSSTASYTAADQTADFGSPQSSIAVKIYQLSEVVGRGRRGEADC
jgi:hypothetical protein